VAICGSFAKAFECRGSVANRAARQGERDVVAPCMRSSAAYVGEGTLQSGIALPGVPMYRTLFAVAAVATLSACSSAPMAQVQPIDGVISGQCHVDKVRGAVGLAASAATVERARVDSDSLQVTVIRGQRTGSGPTASGAADPTPGAQSGGDRLTIETGRTNNITALYCG
jgi:hypothetical protein